FMVMNIDEDIVVQRRTADPEEKAGVFLLIDQPVIRLRRADPVIEDLGWPMVFIKARIEEALALCIPRAAAIRVGDDVLKVLHRRQVADLELVEFRSLVVIAPDQKLVIRRVIGGSEAEICLVLALHVTVEKDGLGAAIARRADEIGLFAAGAIGHAIGIGAILGRNGGVVFLDARAHFGKQ